MGDSMLVSGWLDKAIRDLKCAKTLLEHDCGNDYVAFHCQQTIEKALKAMILYLYAALESGHSLLYLCKKVIEKNNEFSKYIDGCMFVSQYYLETRYPNENFINVTDEEAKKCINIAEKVLNNVLSCIEEE